MVIYSATCIKIQYNYIAQEQYVVIPVFHVLSFL